MEGWQLSSMVISVREDVQGKGANVLSRLSQYFGLLSDR